MGIAGKRRQKTLEFVAPSLEAGEHVQVVLPHGQTGPTPWFFLLTYLTLFWIRYVAIVVTDRRVLFVKRGTLSGRLQGVEATFDRGAVGVGEWRPGALWSVLRLERPDGPLKLNVHRMHRADAEELVAALGQASWSPPPTT